MARTTINSQGVPTGTIVASDLSYPLTNFSSTGIDDNATSTALTIDASERIGIGNTSPSYLIDARTASGNAQIYLRSGGDLGQLLLISNDTTGTSQINFGDADANNIGLISYSHNQNALKFTVNAAERMRIDSAGGLGIGTTNPTYKLVVSNNGEEGLEIDPVNDDQTIRSFYYDRNTSSYIINKSFADQHVWTAGGSSEKMRLNGSGNLGIGTTTPAEKLTVVGEILTGASPSTSGQTILKSEYLSSSGDFINILGTQRSSSAWVLGYGVEPDGSDAAVFNSTADNSSFARGALLVSDELVFSNAAASTTTVGSAITLTERVRIDGSGNVGIGKTPTYKLDISSGADEEVARFENTASFADIFIQDSGTSTGQVRIRAQSNTLQFITNTNEQMRIASSGDVGIGASAPDQKLHIHENSSAGAWAHFTNNTTGASGSNGFLIGIDSNEDARILQYENKDIEFYTNNTERVRILSSGGITFNGDTADANALDDYEEGTWTPSLSTGSATFTSPKYTKIGRLVFLEVLITAFSDRSSGSAIVVNGLPFTTSSNSRAAGSTLSRYINSGGDQVVAWIGTSRNYMTFYTINQGSDYQNVAHQHLNSSSSNFHVSAVYET